MATFESITHEVEAAVRDGRCEALVARAREKLRSHPDALEAWLTVALASKANAELEDALVAFRRSIEIEPNTGSLYVELGIVARNLGRIDAARTAFERALELDPDDADAWVNLGILQLRANDLQGAESSLRRGVALRPDVPHGYANLSWVLRRQDRLAEAVAAGRLAIEHTPDDESFNYLAFAQLALDDPAGALDTCDAALWCNERNVTALAYKTSALDGVGRRAEGRALADFERFLWMAGISGAPGYSSLDEFNRALVEQVLAYPTRPFDPTQTVDIMRKPTGAVAVLEGVINRALSTYVDGLPSEDRHPFLSYRPQRWRIHAWATRTKVMKEQEHHYHQHAWISGVYYVQIPAVVGAAGSGMAGFIEFCRFHQFSHRPVDSEFSAVKPEPGLLVLFPAYFFHRIVPFESPDLRISVAFNVIPLDSH